MCIFNFPELFISEACLTCFCRVIFARKQPESLTCSSIFHGYINKSCGHERERLGSWTLETVIYITTTGGVTVCTATMLNCFPSQYCVAGCTIQHRDLLFMQPGSGVLRKTQLAAGVAHLHSNQPDYDVALRGLSRWEATDFRFL